MKKTCNNCKALYFLGGGTVYCALGYKLDINALVPKENCPKPLTLVALCNLTK